MTTDEPPYLVKLGEAQTAVVRALFDSLPREGWTRCAVEYREAANLAESIVTLTDTNNEATVVKTPPAMVGELMDLRELMSKQGEGAWLSIDFTVTPDGKCVFDYNYDERPRWTVQPTDETYIEDLRRHPRPSETIPDWYPRAN